jgi:hypothetical protein
MSQQWEYDFLSAVNPAALLDRLRDAGAKGWELVSVAYDPALKAFVAFLKRPAGEASEST